jgi:hypothetical protein
MTNLVVRGARPFKRMISLLWPPGHRSASMCAPSLRRCRPLSEISRSGFAWHGGLLLRPICFEHHDYAIKLLECTLQDDSCFAYIASADEGDDWTDP